MQSIELNADLEIGGEDAYLFEKLERLLKQKFSVSPSGQKTTFTILNHMVQIVPGIHFQIHNNTHINQELEVTKFGSDTIYVTYVFSGIRRDNGTLTYPGNMYVAPFHNASEQCTVRYEGFMTEIQFWIRSVNYFIPCYP